MTDGDQPYVPPPPTGPPPPDPYQAYAPPPQYLPQYPPQPYPPQLRPQYEQQYEQQYRPQDGPQYGQQYGPPHPPQGPYGYPYPAVPYPVGYGPRRPGEATGAAVLGFVLAGLLILLGLLLILGGSVTSDIENSVKSGSGVGAELVFDGIVNLVSGGLLIGGGVGLLGGRRSGRTLLLWGHVIVLAAAVYWLTRFGSPGAGAVWPLAFSAMAVISICLAAASGVTRWLTPPGSAPWSAL